MTYKVTAPLVIVKDTEGVLHHIYTGGLLPENADEAHVKLLLDGEMIADADEADEPGKSENASKSETGATKSAASRRKGD